ncbi:hypothetical protein MXL46_19015 [Heyndrickxia sporothermodurans]|uniref:hypothetical protein n=1 Tax=Heyndrickxia sporothermodurans TaxID=46224 RepID=UPI002DBF1413|nr:hypothetical protein [Heyndrickxia sporothermodurans]MEB6551139.1 hypothetical protein [Heyndrickxia sporothermodurans]
MKKILSAFLLGAALFSMPFQEGNNVKAAEKIVYETGLEATILASDTQSAVLSTTQESSSTSRVTAKSQLVTSVSNLGSKDIKYAIFRNGVEYLTGRLVPGDFYKGTLNVSSGEYSLRMYCGVYSRTTGCRASTTITGK